MGELKMTNIYHITKHIIIIISFFLLSLNCYSEEALFTTNGHIKFQPSLEKRLQDYRFDSSELISSEILDIRLNTELRFQEFRFIMQGESITIAGENISEGAPSTTILPGAASTTIINDDTRLFNLSSYVINTSKLMSVARIDRAYFEYASEKIVFRFGRQALSIGNGIVFQAIDLFAPFSPVEIDRDYKTGQDLLYIESLLTDELSVEWIIVPRRENQELHFDAGSYGAVLTWQAPEGSLTLYGLSAWHWGEWNYGLGSSTSISESVIRFDILITQTESAQWRQTLLLNYDTSWTLFGMNTYGFIEYYHNGFGSEHRLLSDISNETRDRLIRGEIYVTGRDFLSAGVRVELRPLIHLSLSEIYSLRDESAFHQVQLQYDILQDANLSLGLNLPMGGRGTEFGGRGVVTERGETAYLRPSKSAYLRMSFFF